MSLRIRIDGHPGRRFSEVIRALPDGARWWVSDPEGAIVIARNDGQLLRELIFSACDDGVWDVECLASEGVSEVVLQYLVGTSLVACLAGLLGVYLAGIEGMLGLMTGLVAAATLPALVLALGQRWLIPPRDSVAEAEMERAMRFAIAHVRGADLINRVD